MCVSWPIRADWVFRRGALKRQELKESVSWFTDWTHWMAVLHGAHVARPTAVPHSRIRVHKGCMAAALLPLTWSLNLIIVKKCDDGIFFYPLWMSESTRRKVREEGERKWKEDAKCKGKKLSLTCCVYSLHHTLHIETLQYCSKTLVWCRYDCLQVVSRSFLPRNVLVSWWK